MVFLDITMRLGLELSKSPNFGLAIDVDILSWRTGLLGCITWIWLLLSQMLRSTHWHLIIGKPRSLTVRGIYQFISFPLSVCSRTFRDVEQLGQALGESFLRSLSLFKWPIDSLQILNPSILDLIDYIRMVSSLWEFLFSLHFQMPSIYFLRTRVTSPLFSQTSFSIFLSLVYKKNVLVFGSLAGSNGSLG